MMQKHFFLPDLENVYVRHILYSLYIIHIFIYSHPYLFMELTQHLPETHEEGNYHIVHLNLFSYSIS